MLTTGTSILQFYALVVHIHWSSDKIMSSECVPQCQTLSFLVIIAVIFSQTMTIAYPIAHPMSSFPNNSQRIFYNTKEQLALTRSTPVIVGEPCNAGPIAAFVHSAAQVSGPHFEKRSAIRMTWASDLKRHNLSYYFVIGLSTNQSINDELIHESNKYKDIIQLPFIDHYFNLTLKAVSILRWIKHYCESPTHILKTDDDVLVNVESLLDSLPQLDNGFFGWLYVQEVPPRMPNHKHYMPFEYYSHWYYPDYTAGNGYVMTRNVTEKLLDIIDDYNDYILVTDDLFITGIIAAKAGVPRHYWPSVDWFQCKDVCDWFRLAVSLECTDTQQMTRYWVQTKNIGYEYCFVEFHMKAVVVIIVFLILSIVFYIVAKHFLTFCRFRKMRKRI